MIDIVYWDETGCFMRYSKDDKYIIWDYVIYWGA